MEARVIMADPVVCKHLLAVLSDMRGGSLPEDSIAVELEARAGKPVSTVQFQSALTFCRDKGWIASREDEWGRDVWWLKDAGKNLMGQ
jgi:hypothetical protein